MPDAKVITAQDLQGLSHQAVVELAQAMLAQLAVQDEQLLSKDAAIASMDEAIAAKIAEVASKEAELAERDREIRFKQARIERLTHELAQLKAWKFGARTEAMSAEQRQLFEDTFVEDEASLLRQLAELKGEDEGKLAPRRQPRRQALPERLRRVEHRHEPEDTTCACGQAMVHVGEDVSERLDVVPAEFFVHRHVYGKWACRCCQTLVQEPAEPQVIDKGMPAPGLLAQVLVSRFVDHLPYYRQEQINARSGVHTPRSTLAAWSGMAAASLLRSSRRTARSC